LSRAQDHRERRAGLETGGVVTEKQTAFLHRVPTMEYGVRTEIP
jgi:hypothetical protein